MHATRSICVHTCVAIPCKVLPQSVLYSRAAVSNQQVRIGCLTKCLLNYFCVSVLVLVYLCMALVFQCLHSGFHHCLTSISGGIKWKRQGNSSSHLNVQKSVLQYSWSDWLPLADKFVWICTKTACSSKIVSGLRKWLFPGISTAAGS